MSLNTKYVNTRIIKTANKILAHIFMLDFSFFIDNNYFPFYHSFHFFELNKSLKDFGPTLFLLELLSLKSLIKLPFDVCFKSYMTAYSFISPILYVKTPPLIESLPDNETLEGNPNAPKTSPTALGSATEAPAFNVNGSAPLPHESFRVVYYIYKSKVLKKQNYNFQSYLKQTYKLFFDYYFATRKDSCGNGGTKGEQLLLF